MKSAQTRIIALALGVFFLAGLFPVMTGQASAKVVNLTYSNFFPQAISRVNLPSPGVMRWKNRLPVRLKSPITPGIPWSKRSRYMTGS